MMRGRAGQAAMEFVVLSSLMFVFFGVTFVAVQNVLVDFTAAGKQAHLESVQDAVLTELSFAQRVPTGYERRFVLPQTIQGLPYSIVIQNETFPRKDALLITIQGESQVRYVDADISGTLHPGTNLLNKTSTGIRFS